MGRKASSSAAQDHPSSRAIAFAIRSKRRQLQMTLRQLATASGLSPAFLSQAERGLTTPSIVSLVHLAKAMGVDVNYFIATPDQGHIIHRAAAPHVIDIDSPLTYHRLTGNLPEHVMEALLIIVPPNLVLPTVTRDGEGFYYVLQGSATITIGTETFELRTGDSAHFDQRKPYTMFNNGKRAVHFLWVGTPPIFG